MLVGGPRRLESGIGTAASPGGWAIALLETLAAGVLLLALSWRLGSWWLAAGIVVFGATAPPGPNLSAVIWNPPVAEAFAKLTTASVLWPGPATLGRSIVTLVLAIGAVQCHVSGVLVAIPLVGYSLWRLGQERGARPLAVATVLGMACLAAWMAPYAIRSDVAAAPERGGVLQSLASVAREPIGRWRPIESLAAVSKAIEFLLLTPIQAIWFRWVLLGGAVALLLGCAWTLLIAGTSPLVVAVGVFSLWQGSFGEAHWFLVVIPATLLCAAGPIIASTGRVRVGGITALIAVTVALQPMRARVTWTEWKQPAYGPLAAGVSAAAATGLPTSDIRPEFTVPIGMDPLFMYSLAGGQLDTAAPVVLIIERDGRTRYAPVRLIA